MRPPGRIQKVTPALEDSDAPVAKVTKSMHFLDLARDLAKSPEVNVKHTKLDPP